jgi:hypothetical protein
VIKYYDDDDEQFCMIPEMVRDQASYMLNGEQNRKYMRFQVLTVASVKFRVFWGVEPCSHIEVGRLLRGAYCLHQQGEAVHTSETLLDSSHVVC